VEGTSVRCPFHGWTFDSSTGEVCSIPYSDRRPPGACLVMHPVVEHSGLILMWFDPEGRAPAYEVPEFREYTDPTFSPFDIRRWTVACWWQEMAENLVDIRHLQALHEMQPVGEVRMATDGPFQRVEFGPSYETSKGAADGLTVTEIFGPGVARVHFSIPGLVETVMISCATPIDKEQLEVRFAFTVKDQPGNPDASASVSKIFAEEVVRQIEQDIIVWEHKRFLSKPLLVAEDGPIREFRAWARQFYVDA
jgi:phenylpropionate dioxygenase-like ring-hydroxylating dioxygenase large terminal subunit